MRPAESITAAAPAPTAIGPRPIVVATDGREAASAAILAAERVATRLGVTPMAVAVIEPPWPTDARIGPTGQLIPRVAAEWDASLVVLGIGRHRVVDRLLGVETALDVLRGTDRPVLAVGPDADGFFRRAVVAVDFGTASARAAAIAYRLLAPGGTLSLVHVTPGLGWSDESPDAHTDARVHEALQRLAIGLRHGTTGCDECGADLGRSDVTIGTAIRVGDPAGEVPDYAECVGADLVALGTRGRGFVERLVAGSVARDVVRQASDRLPACSVLACAAPPPRVAAQVERRLRGAA